MDGGNYKNNVLILNLILTNNVSKSQVVIDDLIPVKNNAPVFVHSSNSGEMWPCLLEKAYSKLQGSYFHLNGGMPLSAMVDFSGGFPLVSTYSKATK